MAGERFDYKTVRDIADPTFGRVAYRKGEGIMAQVVADWGLSVGEDVIPARPDVAPQPGRNAKRAEWAAYRLAQGMDPDKVDGMSRDELRDAEPAKADAAKGE